MHGVVYSFMNNNRFLLKDLMSKPCVSFFVAYLIRCFSVYMESKDEHQVFC